jgi:hypothetical protein
VFPDRLIEVLLEQFAQWQCRLTRAVGENASRSTRLSARTEDAALRQIEAAGGVTTTGVSW